MVRTTEISTTLANLRLVARAWIDLARVDRQLRHGGLEPVIDRIERDAAAPLPTIAPQDIRRAFRYARRIEQASHRHPARPQCLHRSLVLQRWLRSEGFPSELKIGVRKDEQQLKAHAWVEIGGVTINDRPAAVNAFTPLRRQPELAPVPATGSDTIGGQP
ncbi:MAG TPA: lasso peptide biosynthesis B2 protein [Thermomicrobiales bacterium]|nr:lasso peptide biosynthesis B2 protein [Thermomicrobiales bacterium]